VAATGLSLGFCAWRRLDGVALALGGLVVLGAMEVMVWQLLPAMNATRSARPAAGLLRQAAGAARLAVQPDIHPGLVFYLSLPAPEEAGVPLASLHETLQSGRLMVVERNARLLAGGVTLRARAPFQKTEFWLLSGEGERAAAEGAAGRGAAPSPTWPRTWATEAGREYEDFLRRYPADEKAPAAARHLVESRCP